MNTEFCGFFGLVQEKIEIGNHGFYFSTSKYTRSGKNPGFPADFQPILGNQGRPLILSVKIRIGFATCHGSAIIFFCKTKNSVEPRIWAISTPTRYAILYELPETNEIYNKQQCNRNRVIWKKKTRKNPEQMVTSTNEPEVSKKKHKTLQKWSLLASLSHFFGKCLNET